MDKTKSGIIAGFASVVVNVVLFGVKLWAGLMTGSVALVADAWHILSDSVTSVFVMATVKLASRKADTEHPFGHGRWEPIGAIFIGLALGIVAYDFARQAVMQFINRETVVYGNAAIAAAIISIVLKEIMAQYAFYVARKTKNEVVRADAWNHQTDAIAATVVLIGILLAKNFWWIDSALAFLISMTIAYGVYDVLKSSINKMLGEMPGQEFIDEVTNDIVKLYEEDFQIHHWHLHDYISSKELTIHIRLNGDISIANGHEVASSIERLIQDKYNMMATVHVEPYYFKRPA